METKRYGTTHTKSTSFSLAIGGGLRFSPGGQTAGVLAWMLCLLLAPVAFGQTAHPYEVATIDDGASVIAASGTRGSCAGCGITNSANVIDSDLSNFAVMSLPPPAAAPDRAFVSVTYVAEQEPGRITGFAIEGTAPLTASALSDITLTTFSNGTQQEEANGAAELTLDGGEGSGPARVSFRTSKAFDQVEIEVQAGLTLLETVQVYFTFSSALVINEVLADPPETNGDANGDGMRSASDDEFVEVVNLSTSPVDISGLTLSDQTGVRHVFAAGTILEAATVNAADVSGGLGYGVVVFGGGAPADVPGLEQKASSGSLSINNGGDTVTLSTSSGRTVALFDYDSTVGTADQSATREPDFVGQFELHTSAASDVFFSPGFEDDAATALPVELPLSGLRPMAAAWCSPGRRSPKKAVPGLRSSAPPVP